MKSRSGSGKTTFRPVSSPQRSSVSVRPGEAMFEARSAERRTIPAGICSRQNDIGSPKAMVSTPASRRYAVAARPRGRRRLLSPEEVIAPDRRERRPGSGGERQRAVEPRVEIDCAEGPVRVAHQLELEDPTPAKILEQSGDGIAEPRRRLDRLSER